MPIFRKKGVAEEEPTDRVHAFWSWWESARDTVQAAIDCKRLSPELIDEISKKVMEIDRGLAWEVGPGLQRQYQLCVTGEGDIERRAATEWLIRAAPHDRAWEYFPARQAQPANNPLTLKIGPHSFDPNDLRFEVATDTRRERLDLSVWHPLYSQLDDRARAQVTYLLVDGILGEDGVERWCGRIQPLAAPSSGDTVDRLGLKRCVDQLANTATGDQFTLGQAAGADGNVRIVAVNTAVKHIDHLDKPFRLRVKVRLTQPKPNGLPEEPEMQELESFEDLLSSTLRDAVFAGRVTGSGERTLNWYVTDVEAARSAVEPHTKAAGWRVEVRTDPDPRWEGLRKNLLD